MTQCPECGAEVHKDCISDVWQCDSYRNLLSGVIVQSNGCLIASLKKKLAQSEHKLEGEAEALKPCPFCGGDIVGIVTDVTFTQADHSATYSMPPHVACACGACGPREKTEAEAISAWNTRESDLATARAEVERLQEEAIILRSAVDGMLAPQFEDLEAEARQLREAVQSIKPPRHYSERCDCYGCCVFRQIAAALTPSVTPAAGGET